MHIVKLCVGIDAIEDLATWQRSRIKLNKHKMAQARLFHTTRMVPRRQTEILDGGSIYWVIRGAIQVRQQITGFDEGQKSDGTKACQILLSPKLVPVRPTPRRAFQGWRYLEANDAPPDLAASIDEKIADLPAQMRRELAELCLL
ncbi:MAG: DUF1489 family protein [Hyphomicrobiaceae bacterium]